MSAMPVVDAHRLGPIEGHDTDLARASRPWVLIAIDHTMMRALTRELLERTRACRVTCMGADDQALAIALHRGHPDLLILDTGEFPARCRAALGQLPAARVIVIGPEPCSSYRRAALAGGAGAWLSRDRVGDDLVAEVLRLLTRHAHAGPQPTLGSPGPDARR